MTLCLCLHWVVEIGADRSPEQLNGRIGWAFRCSSGKVFMLDKPEALDWEHSTENHEYEAAKTE